MHTNSICTASKHTAAICSDIHQIGVKQNDIPVTEQCANDLEKETLQDPTSSWQRRNETEQDDNAFLVICGLRSVLARFCIWINMPFTWCLGGTIATGHVDRWLNLLFGEPNRKTAAITFVAMYVIYTVLTHTIFVYAALAHELWWNPYARAPSLRCQVDREEETAMLRTNRLLVRRVWTFILR